LACIDRVMFLYVGALNSNHDHFHFSIRRVHLTLTMDAANSRPATPDAPPQDLWSSILDSVSSSRSIPAKQIVILGQPSSGKSTLAAALLQKPVLHETDDDLRLDFAIGYDFADVKDDADEGMLSVSIHSGVIN
jgi:hypothetical protein